MRHSGYTLVEVLVAIAVVAILVALLSTAAVGARQRSHTTVCLSNMRQLGMSISMYGTEYDDRIPYAVDCVDKATVASGLSVYGSPTDHLIANMPDIRTVLRPYGADAAIFRCPSDRFLPFDIEPHPVPTWFAQYGSSYYYSTLEALIGLTLNSHGAPASDILLSDYSPFHGGDDEAGWSHAWTNVLYADGHAKTVTWTTRSEAIDNPPH